MPYLYLIEEYYDLKNQGACGAFNTEQLAKSELQTLQDNVRKIGQEYKIKKIKLNYSYHQQKQK